MLKRTTATRLCRSTRHPDHDWNLFTLHRDVSTPDAEVPGGVPVGDPASKQLVPSMKGTGPSLHAPHISKEVPGEGNG